MEVVGVVEFTNGRTAFNITDQMFSKFSLFSYFYYM